MNILFALAGTLIIITGAAFLLWLSYSLYWFARHALLIVALDRDRIQELYEQDAGVQHAFFAVKCVCWIYIWPVVLFQCLKDMLTNQRIDRQIRQTVHAKYPNAQIIKESQGEKITYRVRLKEGDDEFTCTN